MNHPLEQASALIALRAKLWWRRLVHGRQWVRFAVGAVAALVGVMFSASLCVVIFEMTDRMRQSPEALPDLGGPSPRGAPTSSSRPWSCPATPAS